MGMRPILAVIVLVAFAATIPLANWMIGNWGTECIPNGPCLIPVGFGLMAPSGVLVIGAALVLRDALQQLTGVQGALVAIALGAILSFFVAPPALVIASVLAFTLSELADLGVYTPLRKKNLGLAVLLSGIVGALIDSAVFLYIAFGSLDFVLGQWVGKMWASLFGFIVIIAWRKYVASQEANRYGRL